MEKRLSATKQNYLEVPTTFLSEYSRWACSVILSSSLWVYSLQFMINFHNIQTLQNYLTLFSTFCGLQRELTVPMSMDAIVFIWLLCMRCHFFMWRGKSYKRIGLIEIYHLFQMNDQRFWQSISNIRGTSVMLSLLAWLQFYAAYFEFPLREIIPEPESNKSRIHLPLIVFGLSPVLNSVSQSKHLPTSLPTPGRDCGDHFEPHTRWCRV